MRHLDGLGLRADEDDALLAAAPRELGVLGQEAVAGVDAVHLLILGQPQDALHQSYSGASLRIESVKLRQAVVDVGKRARRMLQGAEPAGGSHDSGSGPVRFNNEQVKAPP